MSYPSVKRVLDVAAIIVALPLLVPLFLALVVAIKLDSPGSAFFRQNRFGKDRRLFKIYKFRTMHMDSPGDIPTHMFNDPQDHITRLGGFLRRSSLDELPQIFNVLAGDLSLVGPRPVLWNELELIAEREKYGANSVRPGITGLAQIKGRDILTLQDKARYDGEYVKNMSFWLDLKILALTLPTVVMGTGVREGRREDAAKP